MVECALGEFLARDAAGETEVVADSRGRSGLASHGGMVEHEAGRAATDDGDVECGPVGSVAAGESVGQLGGGWIAKHGAVVRDHHGQDRVVGAGISKDLSPLIGVDIMEPDGEAVACKEIS